MRLFEEIVLIIVLPINPIILSNPPPKKKSKRNANDILRYSGMAFQMAFILGLGVYIGTKLDAHYGFDKQYLTALCALIAFPIAFYIPLKGLFK